LDIHDYLNRYAPLQPCVAHNPTRIAFADPSSGKVHLAEISDSMLKGVTGSNIKGLLGFHGGLHDSMVALQGLNVVVIRLEHVLFDSLAKAVLRDELDNLISVLFLGVDPSNHLIHGERIRCETGMKFIGLDHGLADGFASLLDFGNNGGVIKDSTGDLTMSTSKTKHEMERRLLLNVVIAQGTTIFKLLTSEDETLLIWGNTFLVLDLSFDVVNGVVGLDIERNSLASKSLYKYLSERGQLVSEAKRFHLSLCTDVQRG
jgi:hypothetical protein